MHCWESDAQRLCRRRMVEASTRPTVVSERKGANGGGDWSPDMGQVPCSEGVVRV